MEHDCKHETDLALMAQGIKDLTKSQDKNFGKLFKIIEGNGNDGLVTQTALNKASITRAWWFIGAISIIIIGAAIRAFI